MYPSLRLGMQRQDAHVPSAEEMRDALISFSLRRAFSPRAVFSPRQAFSRPPVSFLRRAFSLRAFLSRPWLQRPWLARSSPAQLQA